MRYLVIAAVLCALGAAFAVDAHAQGIVLERRVVVDRPTRPPTEPLPQPLRRWPMQLKDHRVEVTIEDQAVVTKVTQVFFNPNAWPMEGVYLFPLPEHASVSRFTMSMAGKQVPGEVVDADRAREIYRSIVYERRDPGLLEYAGRRLIRARLFPLPPRGDTKVELRYEQVLEPIGGMIEMVYPLKTDTYSPSLVHTSGTIEIRAQAGVQTVFSPSHKLDVVRRGDDRVVASFEENARADRDLRVLYGLGRKRFGLSLATHKPAGEDGYFMMLVSPSTPEGAQVLPKDVVFVLDTSGSMGDRGGQKLKQAKKALRYALGRLDGRDRFNVIAFATAARPFREGVVAASDDNVAAAMKFIDGLEATGGTAIHDALLEALKLERGDGRVPIVLFLTDGEPTIGPTDTTAILKAAATANGAEARVFVFGVGDDVNATLLTELSDNNRGTAHFVAERENIELKVSALYDKVASPVLTDVTVSFGGAEVFDVYPRRLGDLFKGQQVRILGRFKGGGDRSITLQGRLGDRTVSHVYEASFDAGNREYLPRLWAVRKIGFLLDQIRKNGEQRELVKEVKALGTRYGIVTPYTSWLVVEEGEMLRRRWRRQPQLGGAPADAGAREGLISALDSLDTEMKAAGEALKKKDEAGKGAVAAGKMSARYQDSGGDLGGVPSIGVKRIGGKTFRRIDGVWTDLSITPESAKDKKVVRVKYLGDDYAALLKDDKLARYLSVGERVRVLFHGRIYEVEA